MELNYQPPLQVLKWLLLVRVPVTVVVEEAVTVTIAMVPEMKPVEDAVEHKMTL